MVVVPEPIIPPEVPGQLIRGDFGSGSPAQLIPAEGATIRYGKPGEKAAWQGVWGWVRGQFLDDTKAPAQLNMPNVLDAILQGMKRLQEAMSGFHNLVADYTATVAEQGAHATQFVFLQAHHLAQLLQHEIDALALLHGTMIDNNAAEVRHQVRRLDDKIQQTNTAQTQSVQRWAVDNIYAPLKENIGDLGSGLWHLIDAKTLTALGAAQAFTLTQTGPIQRILSNLSPRVAALEKWVDDCGEPMCQMAGPKTDLGKWLKGLKVAEWLALTAILAAMSEDDLRRLGEQVVALAGGRADDFVRAFFDEGRTLGGAAGDVIGGIG